MQAKFADLNGPPFSNSNNFHNLDNLNILNNLNNSIIIISLNYLNWQPPLFQFK